MARRPVTTAPRSRGERGVDVTGPRHQTWALRGRPGIKRRIFSLIRLLCKHIPGVLLVNVGCENKLAVLTMML